MTHRTTPTRRAVLSVLGTGIATGIAGQTALAQQTEARYALVQGEACAPVQPLRGPDPVEALYDYQLPERYVSDVNGATVGTDAPWASAGTIDLQRAQTSIAFLYRGPNGLSLVFVHGSVGDPDAGSVTFRLAGPPEDGAWLVRDDYYLDPETGEPDESNYDRWAVDGPEHQIDWTWGSAGTDGGVFGYLGDDFDVVVEPAFNEAATLFDQHYEGTVSDWEFITVSGGSLTRLSLAMDAPIRIASGRCADVLGPVRTPAGTPTGPKRDEDRDRDRDDRDEDRDREKDRDRDEDRDRERDRDEDRDRKEDRERDDDDDDDDDGPGRGNGKEGRGPPGDDDDEDDDGRPGNGKEGRGPPGDDDGDDNDDADD